MAAKAKPTHRAIILCRVSSPDDTKQGDSIEEQERVGRIKAQELGYLDSEIQVEPEHFTGEMLWERPVLSKVREQIAAGGADCFIVKKLDRLARDHIWQGVVIREMLKRGCRVEIILEPLDSSSEGELIRYVRGYASKIELAQIKERTYSGKMRRRRLGKRQMSTWPYGYLPDKENGTLTVDPETSPTVVQIFEWASAGKSSAWIARSLTDSGVPPSTADKQWRKKAAPVVWGNSTIQHLVRSPIYRGDDYWGRTQSVGKLDSGFCKMRKRPAEEWFSVDSKVPPIVSAELWESANASMTANRRGGRAADATRNEEKPVLLRGLAWCEFCDRRLLYSASGKPGKKHYGYYRCVTNVAAKSYTGQPRCEHRPVSAPALEETVWKKLHSIVDGREKVRKVLSEYQADGSTDLLKDTLRVLEGDIVRQKKTASILASKHAAALAEGDAFLAEAFSTAMADARHKLSQIEEKAVGLRIRVANLDDADLSVKAFEETISNMRMIVAEFNGQELPFDKKRLLLEALRTRVTASGKQVHVYFNAVMDSAIEGSSSTQTVRNCGNLHFVLSLV